MSQRRIVPPDAIVSCSGAGETYIINENGEKLIAASRRPDGSIRRAIRVRPGFTPIEERAKYVSKGAQMIRDGQAARVSPPGVSEGEPAARKARARGGRRRGGRKETANVMMEIEEPTFPSCQVSEAPADEPMLSNGSAKSAKRVDLPDELEELEKRHQLLRKKSIEAKALKRRQEEGKSILPNQEAKVERLGEFLEQLETIEKKIEQLKV